MKIVEELVKLGLELTDEQKAAITKKFSEDVISNFEHEKKLGKAQAESDNWKQKAEEAEKTLLDFKGKDFDAIQKECDDWKQRAEAAERDFKKQIAERDYADAVEKHVGELTFSSESAKKAYVADLKVAALAMKEGKIYGLKDFQEGYAKNDPDAFITEEQTRAEGNKAMFTTRMESLPKPGTKVSPEKLMQMKNENQGLDMKKKIETGTIVRTVVLVAALVNQALVILGHNPLPYSDEEVGQAASMVITVGASLWTWWENNSFTQVAIEADEVLHGKE